jgi:ribonuclease P protein component
MKSKIVSLSKNEDFKNLLKGKKCFNKYFTLFYKKINNKNNKNLNISFVTKKKLGNAVKRNKIKRRLKNMTNEAVKKNLTNFNYSYLVIAKNTVFNDDYTNIKKTLFSDFERIK